MEIGIALPNMIPNTLGRTMLGWAARADQRGFSSLAALERIIYPGYDPLLALAAAAGVTRRIRLLTDVLLAPLRSPVVLAKDAAGLQLLSEGRLVLGLAPGVREDDFVAAERDFPGRFRRFDRDLETMHSIWRGELVDGITHSPLPRPLESGAVPILMGGFSDRTIERMAQWATGWVAPGLPASELGPFAARVRSAWQAAGREGEPHIAGIPRFALGADVEGESWHNARDYFAVLGAEGAEAFAADTARSDKEIREVIRSFEDAGFNEVIFNPTVGRTSQVDRLADAVF